MKVHDTWQVLPHGEIEQLADNLYTVVGKLRMPLAETTRRMTVVKLSGDRLAIYSAIALAPSHMAKLEAIGTPTYLIVPSAIHRLDAKAWRDRYPHLEVIAPAGALDKINKVVAVDATQESLGDSRAHVFEVPGTDGRELAMTVKTQTGTTLVVNDLIFNMPAYKGLVGLGLKLLGFGPGHPHIPKLVKRKLVADDARVREQLREWAAADFERILVAHGAPIENPRETLLELAAA